MTELVARLMAVDHNTPPADIRALLNRAASAIQTLVAERDAARRLVIEADWCNEPTAKRDQLVSDRGWHDPFVHMSSGPIWSMKDGI